MAVLQRNQPEASTSSKAVSQSSTTDARAFEPIKDRGYFPPSTFTRALSASNGTRLPQTISHRGFKAKFPENTMVSFQGAIDAGTHAIETDTHITRDGIVVLSHDPSLLRCFGQKRKIIDCDWEYISSLRTTGPSPQPMPRFAELLKLMAKPQNQHIWLLLDIKTDTDADLTIRLIAETIASVQPLPDHPWNSRIVLGIWASRYLPLCYDYLPNYSVSHISVSPILSSTFLKVPNISHNNLILTLLGPIGARLRRKCKEASRPVYSWTVNQEAHMRWCIKQELDGVVTDDPSLFLSVCRDVEEKGRRREKEGFGVRSWFYILFMHCLLGILLPLYMRSRKIGWKIDKKFIKN